MNLCVEQREAILKLGNTESVAEVISEKALRELVDLGIVHRRESDGNLDLTDLGESVYGQLSREE